MQFKAATDRYNALSLALLLVCLVPFPPPHRLLPLCASSSASPATSLATLHYHHIHQSAILAVWPLASTCRGCGYSCRLPRVHVWQFEHGKRIKCARSGRNRPLFDVVDGTKFSLLLKKIKCRHARSSGCGSVRQRNRSISVALEFGAEFPFFRFKKKAHAGQCSDTSFTASSATAILVLMNESLLERKLDALCRTPKI